MSSKYLDDNTQSKNPFVDKLIKNLKMLTYCSVAKDSDKADRAETAESLKEAELYILCMENRATIEVFPSIPEQFLRQVGLTESDINRYITFKSPRFIPADNEAAGITFRKDLLAILQPWYIANFEEKNEYYRMITGQPPLGEWGIPVRDYEKYLPEGFSYQGEYIHEISLDERRELANYGVIDIMRADYAGRADLRYLDYITTGITLYDARRAYDFSLLYTPDDGDYIITQEWIHRYQERREYIINQAYTSAMEIENPDYHSVMQIYLFIMVMVDMLADIQSHIVKKDILDRRCIDYIFSMYGVPYYRDIPYKFQERICFNLHNLLKYKSSTTELLEIARIFEMDDCRFYKYYIMKHRKMDEYGNFIWAGEDILKCSYNEIIEHKYYTENLSDPSEKSDVPDDLTDVVIVTDPKRLRELSYQDREIDDSETIEDTETDISDETVVDDTSDPLFGNDYVDRYIKYPIRLFLQRGNILVVTLDDVVLEEGKDYYIPAYNRIRLKGELVRNATTITYHFYYDKETKDDVFKVDTDHALTSHVVVSTDHTDNSIDISSLNLPTRFWEDNYDMMVMVGSVFIPKSSFTIEDRKTINIVPAIRAVGRQVTVIALYSQFQKSVFEKRVTKVVDDEGKIEIPEPSYNYVAYGNSFFITIGSTFIDPGRYTITCDTKSAKSYITFNSDEDSYKFRSITFNFVYSLNSIANEINIIEKDDILQPTQSYQTEFPYTFPVSNYAGNGYKLYIKAFGEWLPSTSYTYSNEMIFILDQSMAVRKDSHFDIKLKYYGSDRTRKENSNIKVEYGSVTATENHQTQFKIKFPIARYLEKMNKVILTVKNAPIPEDGFDVEMIDDYNGILTLHKEYKICRRGEIVDYMFVYNADTEYHTKVAMQQVSDKGLDENSRIDLNYPFYPYLQSGHDFIVIYGSIYVTKDRIKMVNEFQFTIAGLEPEPEQPRNITILYLYSDWYITNQNKLIKETRRVDISSHEIDFSVDPPFEHYFDNNWPFYITKDGSHLVPEAEIDLVDSRFSSIPPDKMVNGEYGDYLDFTYIYLIRAPYVWPATREDYTLTTDLRFCKIPIDDLYSSKYLLDQSKWKYYDPMVIDDGWWAGLYYKEDNYNIVKNQILEDPYNYARTKYYSVDKIIELSSYSAKLSFFFSALFDDILLENNLNVIVKDLSETHRFNLAHLILYMTCLSHIYNGIEDIILEEPNDILYASGFNYRASLEDLKDYIRSKHYDPDDFPIWDMIIPTGQISDIAEFVNIQKNNEEVYHMLRNRMIESQDAREYRIWNHIYEALMTWKFNLDYYRLSDGTLAKTYSEFLKDKDAILYASLEKVKAIKDRVTQIDAITTLIDDICFILSEYIDEAYGKYIYSEFAGMSTASILSYMMKIVEFFKSYKIVFKDHGEQITIGQGGTRTMNEDSVIRFYDMATIRERKRIKEYFPIEEKLHIHETKHVSETGPWFKEYCTITTKHADGKEEVENV